MNLASRLAELRKQKGWSQNQLAKRVDVSREIIGRYERSDAIPSIDIAKKMATELGVSLDYLVGVTDQKVDADTLRRVLDIEQLQQKEKEMVFAFLDSFLTTSKLRTLTAAL